MKNVQNIEIEDIRKVNEIALHMGIVKLPNRKLYQNRSGSEMFSDAASQNRFD